MIAMTDPTREAFEAWWNDCDIPWAEEPEHFAWAAWQAALSALPGKTEVDRG